MNDSVSDQPHKDRMDAMTSYLVSTFGDTSIPLSSESTREDERFRKMLGRFGLDSKEPEAEVRLRLDILAEFLVEDGYVGGKEAPSDMAFKRIAEKLEIAEDDISYVKGKVAPALREWPGMG